MRKIILFFAFLGIITINDTKAQIIIASGNCGATGNNLTWELDSDSVLTITGSGKMGDYTDGTTPWYSNCFGIKTVIIGNSATSIGNYAFSNCIALASITLPNTITSIGNNAFENCIALTSITLSDPVTSIGISAFQNCSKLNSITLSNSLISVGNSAFYGCSVLSSITFPNSVTSIGAYVFWACNNLGSIICKAAAPPAIQSNTFANLSKSIPVYVYCASVNTYKAATYWSEFTNYQIIGLSIPEEVTVVQQNNALAISWKDTGMASYNIYRNNVFLAKVSTATYLDNDVTHGEEYCYEITALNDDCESSLSEKVCQTVGTSTDIISDIAEDNVSITIYPNPTTGELRIENGELKINDIAIFDIMGRNVNLSTRPLVNSSTITIDISHLPAGIYLVQIKTETGIIVKKIMKE